MTARESAPERPSKPASAAHAGRAGKAPQPSRLASADLSGVDLSDLDVDLGREPEAESTRHAGTAATTRAKPLRTRVSRARERAPMHEFGLEQTAPTEEEASTRRQEPKTLTKLGKTRGFLTHQEINHHLTGKLANGEILEAIATMLNDMGSIVYEQAPDAATLLIASGCAPTDTEEAAEEAAAAALSTVDAAFGRSTDPVRLYGRELGTVALLTREGEIGIAKRIESDLQAMMLAFSVSPTTIAQILNHADQIGAGTMKASETVVGFVSGDEADGYVARKDVDFFHEDDDGQASSKALTHKLGELTAAALARFDTLRVNFDKMRKAFEKDAFRSPAYGRAQQAISAELMTIRLTVKTIEKLRVILRAQVDDVRHRERGLRRIVVDKCGMPQAHFNRHSPPTLLTLNWTGRETAASKAGRTLLARNLAPVQELQKKLIAIQAMAMVPLEVMKRIGKRINEGDQAARDTKRKTIEANLRLVIAIANPYPNRGRQFLDFVR